MIKNHRNPGAVESANLSGDEIELLLPAELDNHTIIIGNASEQGLACRDDLARMFRAREIDYIVWILPA
jgi:hypothetical protein